MNRATAGWIPLRQKARLAANWAWDRLCSCLDTTRCRLSLWLWGAMCGENLSVAGTLRCRNAGQLVIGANVKINSGHRRNFVGGDNRTALWIGKHAALEIGDSVGMSGTTIVCLKKVRIGEETIIGGGCAIFDTDFHPHSAAERESPVASVACKEVIIGRRVFIGARSIILKGSIIGDGALIGAGSIVRGTVGPHELWAGTPARFIRKLA